MTITPEQLADRLADAERLVSTLADLLEDREWDFDDSRGREENSCRSCGARFYMSARREHKADCELAAALAAARAMGEDPTRGADAEPCPGSRGW
jgi:hypothetical protein